MFDPQTANLIRSVPDLPGLDRDRLPEDLTQAFAAIVAFRLRLTENPAPPSEELQAKLEEFRRMGATFEGMVALSPDFANRRAAAFVAAQVHHLLIVARRTAGGISEPESVLRSDAISPTISALLLFLIADQTSDAMEMARLLPQRANENNSIEALLTGALVALAHGRLSEIVELVALRQTRLAPDRCEAAVEALYGRILEGLGFLSTYLRDVRNSPRAGATATEIFREVQNLSAEPQVWPVVGTVKYLLPALSTFPGPHHLATLLLSAAGFLGSAALSAIEPPPRAPLATWNELLKSLIERRPFLWPNHLKALAEGFLNLGTSSVVTFPTGAGKTTLSVLKASAALAAGGAVVYLAPTHALVAQMKRELREVFPPRIPVRESLLVEDFYSEIGESFETAAPQIVVMTPERCLALLSLGNEGFGTVRLVIFDECHLLHPREGGQNRRSLDAMLALLYLREVAPEADWLLLSAMIQNVEELSGWLSELTGRRCIPLTLDWKPTRQARGCLVYDRTEINTVKTTLAKLERESRREVPKLRNPGVTVQRQLEARPFGFFCLQQNWKSKSVKDYTLLPLSDSNVPLAANRSQYPPINWYLTPNKNTVAAHLAAMCTRIGLRVLLFAQSPKDAASIAKKISEIADENPVALTDNEAELLRIAIDEVGEAESVVTPESIAGCHHGGMLVSERELAESLFKRANGLQALAATPTLAQGMNLPADIVFIVGDARFDTQAQGFAKLQAHELLNAAGRAGRAGHVAQGLVVVLTHSLVDFDPQKRQIGKGWTQLRALFSSDDQCLVVDDPLRHLIDRIQVAATDDDGDVRYFLRRLPRGGTASQDFLASTLGAWRARHDNQEAQFNILVQRTLARRDQLAPESEAENWEDDLAFRMGIAVELIRALSDELLARFRRPILTTEAWVRWYFGWLASHPEWLDTLFGHRLTPELRAEIGHEDLFGGKLAEIVWAWMSGETLRSLNARLGGNPVKPGICPSARKFVLKLIPELAFAAGLATRIRRKQLEEANKTNMPLTLATLGLCVREGVSEPEIAALRLVSSQPHSRSQLIKEWSVLEGLAAPRKDEETFGRTRERVSAALAASTMLS